MTHKKQMAHKKNDSTNFERGKAENTNNSELENIGLNNIEGIESDKDLLQKQDLKMRGYF
ncbi:hypothetical protein [Clostridium sp.]|uniref:hypothetical protein n=1 Tax=Clostridium sp. TaxID=1506 RepID=UPI003D6CC48C